MSFGNRLLLLLCLSVVGGTLQPRPTRAVEFAASSSRDGDAAIIARCADRQDHCLGVLRTLRNRTGREPDFLSPREHDVLEQSLAEYLGCRDHLAQIARRHKPAAAELAELSLRCQAEKDVQLAALALDDAVLQRALNQSFQRSKIASGSYDRIVYEVTASHVRLAGESREQLNAIIHRRGWLLPSLENDIRHVPPLQLILDSGSSLSSQLQHGQNRALTSISRIQNPAARPLAISEEMRRQIRESLQPGDVLLTFTAGLTSNLIIPGQFKHAAIFVGTEAERGRLGLGSEKLLAVAGPSNQRLRQALQQSTTASGQAADVVESISEGVLLNNFGQILSTRVNRLAVLRPGLNDSERAAQLADVLSYVGDRFDFSFDLTDASAQVCTEVVYRCLQGRGKIDIPLTRHAGRLTLTADDLARYSLQGGGKILPCVLLVDQAPDKVGATRVSLPAEAQQRLAELLGPRL